MISIFKGPFLAWSPLRASCKCLCSLGIAPTPKCSTFFNWWPQNVLVNNQISEIHTRFPQDSFSRKNQLLCRPWSSERCEWRFRRHTRQISMALKQILAIWCIHTSDAMISQRFPVMSLAMKIIRRAWCHTSWVDHGSNPWYHTPCKFKLVM